MKEHPTDENKTVLTLCAVIDSESQKEIEVNLKKYFPNPIIPAEGPRKLVVSKLTRTATERELQTAASQKTTWADLKWELEQQPKGKSGNLLTNGWANLRFIGG
jgi:hypothetical protein